MKPLKYSEVFVLKISKTQKQTLQKIKQRGFVIQKFVRMAIKEKIEREHKYLQQQIKKQYTPF